MTQFKTGEAVWWHYEARGGYGYILKVPALVRSVGKRISIAALKKDGTCKVVYVKPEKLSKREGVKNNP